ncbi:hypothetical protein RugamoR57_37450 [Duganella caerulea]
MSYTQTSRVSIADYTLNDGETLIHADFPAATPAVLAIHPDPGATATVSVSISTPARIAAGTARWVPAALGAGGSVSVPTITDIPAPLTAIRVSASGGAVAVEVAQ